jgi:HD-GYP domain-containing protein (c-di-GMP phosphodiesterase class II)
VGDYEKPHYDWRGHLQKNAKPCPGLAHHPKPSAHNIPLLARILQVADIYDALTTARAYKSAFTSEEAFRIMEEEMRRGWRDPEVTPLFISLLQHQLGSPEFAAMQVSLQNMQMHLAL